MEFIYVSGGHEMIRGIIKVFCVREQSSFPEVRDLDTMSPL